MIHRWRWQLREDGVQAFLGNKRPRDEELSRFKRELWQAKKQVAIFKKAVGCTGDRPPLSAPSL